jgi:hypothetical protein
MPENGFIIEAIIFGGAGAALGGWLRGKLK